MRLYILILLGQRGISWLSDSMPLSILQVLLSHHERNILQKSERLMFKCCLSCSLEWYHLRPIELLCSSCCSHSRFMWRRSGPNHCFAGWVGTTALNIPRTSHLDFSFHTDYPNHRISPLYLYNYMLSILLLLLGPTRHKRLIIEWIRLETSDAVAIKFRHHDQRLWP